MTAQNLFSQRGIETAQSRIVAGTALLILSIAYGASLVTVVALKPIAANFGTQRAGPALAVSLTYIGSGLGGAPACHAEASGFHACHELRRGAVTGASLHAQRYPARIRA